MSGRGEQLTRVALRLGLLIGGMAGAWSAYDAVTADVAHATDAPHTVTVDARAGSLPSPLSRLAGSTEARTDPPQSAETPDPTSGAGDEVAATPPDAPSGEGTEATPTTDPHRTTAPTPNRRTRCEAPDHRAGPSPTTTRRTTPGTTPARARGKAPATIGDRPITKPVFRSPSPAPGPAPRPHPTAPRPHDPVPPPAEPAPGTPDRPTGPPAPPPVDRGVDDPAEDADPPTAPTEPAEPTAPSATAVGQTTGTQITVTHRDPATGHWSPAVDRERGGHPDVVRIVASTDPAPRPARPDIEPSPVTPTAPGNSAGTSHAAHGEAADAAAVGWAPLLARGEACRPARADALSSRSPRPGSRPA